MNKRIQIARKMRLQKLRNIGKIDAKFRSAIKEKGWIQLRCLEEASLISLFDLTQRELAEIYGISHSTVWHDLNVKLPKINKTTSEQVQMIMKRHKDESLIGGERCKIRRK